MQRPLPPFYDKYIELCNDVSLLEALKKYTLDNVFDSEKLTQLNDKAYAENKWTAKQIIQHCIDTERIMTYRALRFARNDTTELPGFDENLFAENASVSEVSVNDLMEEFSVLRKSTELLFSRMSVDELQRTGVMSNLEISVEHIGFMLIGHAIHHQFVIAERYYPLI